LDSIVMALTFNSHITGFCGSSRGNSVPLSSTRYISANGGVPNATENAQTTPVANDGIFRWAIARISTTQPGTGSLVFTWRKNGVDTSIIITIAASSTAGNFTDMTNSFSVVAGDVVGVKIVNNATSVSAAITGNGSLFHGVETSYSHIRTGISCSGNAGTVTASTTTYTDFLSSGFGLVETGVQNVVSMPCSATDLYIKTGNAQSGTGSLVFTLRKNNVDTSTVVTISAGSGAGAYFSSTATDGFIAGDTLGLKVRNNATAASAQIASKSIYLYDPKRRPRTSMNSLTGNDSVVSGGTEFTPGIGGGSFSAVETQRFSHAPAAGVFRYFYVVTTSTQKAAGATTFTWRKNQVDSSLVVVIAANSAPGVYSDLTNSSTCSIGDNVTIKGANPSVGVSATVRFAIFFGE